MTDNRLVTLVKDIDNRLCELISHVICSICQEFHSDPLITPCGHSFCAGCIKRALFSKGNSGCPLCKYPVKRYSLEADKAGLMFSNIFQELPEAFVNDVYDLQSCMEERDVDLVKVLKLHQLLIQEKSSKPKEKRKEISAKAKADKKLDISAIGDAITLPTVLENNKNLFHDKSDKKEKLNDLNLKNKAEPKMESNEFKSWNPKKKLYKSEKIQSYEKIKDWVESVKNEIYPCSPILSPSNAPVSKIQNSSPSDSFKNMYKCIQKSLYSLNVNCTSESDSKEQEYLNEASQIQNDEVLRKTIHEKQRKSKIQVGVSKTYAKKSSKLNSLLHTSVNKQCVSGLGCDRSGSDKDTDMARTTFTASQKFDQLLADNKKRDNSLALHSTNEVPSPQFPDACHSESGKILPSSCDDVKYSSTENLSPIDLFIEPRNNNEPKSLEKRMKASEKRRRSRFSTNNSYSELINMTSDDALELEKGVQNLFKNFEGNPCPATGNYFSTDETSNASHERVYLKSTNLMRLLEEVLNDSVIQANYPPDEPLTLGENTFDYIAAKVCDNRTNCDNFSGILTEKNLNICEAANSESREWMLNTQDTCLIGFNAEEEPPQKKILKNIVAAIENELLLSELSLSSGFREEKDPEIVMTASLLSFPNRFQQTTPMNRMSERKISSVSFSKLGRLTPTSKRMKSSVVKLIFPTGFMCFGNGGKQATRPRDFNPIHNARSSIFSRENPCACRNENFLCISPSNPMCSVSDSTSFLRAFRNPEVSVQVPIVQKEKNFYPAEVKRYESTGIQTSQVPLQSVCIQTTKNFKTSSIGNQTSPKADVSVSPAKESKTVNFDEDFQQESVHGSTSRNLHKRKRFEKTMTTFDELKKAKRRHSIESFSLVSSSSSLTPSLPPPPLSLSTTRKKLTSFEPQTNIEMENNASLFHKKSIIKFESSKTDRMTTPGLHSAGNGNDSDGKPNKYVENSGISKRKNYASEINWKLDEESEETKAELSRVMKNIDSELPVIEGEIDRSEESDSDFFVEQTPPRPKYSVMDNSRRLKNQTVENTSQRSFIETNDGFSASQKIEDVIEPDSSVSAAAKNSSVEKLEQYNLDLFSQKRTSTSRIEKKSSPEGNDAGVSKDKSEKKASTSTINPVTTDTWKRFEFGALKKPRISPTGKPFCVAASSVTNLELVKKFASEFKMIFSNRANKDLTHLIVGLHKSDDGDFLPLCTPKFLFAIANKKWIVSEAWAKASLKLKKVLDEEEFETCDPLGGTACRNARLSSDYLFKNCQICLMGNFENISKEELADLILDCGGTLVSSPEKFSSIPMKMRLIIVDKDCISADANELQALHEKFRSVILSRDAIIMSIQSYELSNFAPYMMHSASTESLVGMGYPVDLVTQEDTCT